MDADEIRARIAECTDGPWYQPMKYGGISVPVKDDLHPASFGIGKWNNYIGRLLRQCNIGNGYFCDMGCNAGMYLVAAAKAGYKRLWGIEGAKTAHCQLRLTRDFYCNLDIRPIFAVLGPPQKNIADTDAPPFNLGKFPIVDVTLMANVHYYIPEVVLKDYFKKLALKSRYLIIVTDLDVNDSAQQSSADMPKLKSSGWQGILAFTTPKRGPGQRNLASGLYESTKLQILDVETLYSIWLMKRPDNIMFYGKVWPNFIRRVLAGEQFKSTDTEVYKWITEGKYGSAKWKDLPARRKVIRWKKMIKEFADIGQRRPVKILGDWSTDFIDGCHRLGICHHLKIPYIYGVKDVRTKCDNKIRQ